MIHLQTKYFEKTFKESHINVFKSLEIENYLRQLLKKKGYTLHSYRIHFSNATIQIFVSAYKKPVTTTKKHVISKTKKTKSLNEIKSENILKTINHFIGNKFHISLKLLNLNNHTKLKKDFNFSKFKIIRMEQLYSIIAHKQGSASLLGTFIAEYLKSTKRHNFFFNSLRKDLNSILKQPNHNMKGIKISVKGRLNNAARSNNKYIKIGSSPLIAKSQNLDYSESTAYTLNGTIGIKVWVCYKKNLDFVVNKKQDRRLKVDASVKNY